MYHIATDAIVILDVFPKKTAATPKLVIAECRERLAEFHRVVQRQRGAQRARR
jgi:phage-related protein